MLTEFNLADWKTEDKEWVKARKQGEIANIF